MATKNFRSTVLEPTSEFAHGDKLRFTALATVGEVLKGSFSEATIGEDGVYSIDLQYGKHRIDYKPYEGVWRHFADVEVNADTLATTLQDLALASVPVTDEAVLVLQGILADAEVVKTESAAIRDEAAASAAAAAADAAKLADVNPLDIGAADNSGACYKPVVSDPYISGESGINNIKIDLPFSPYMMLIELTLNFQSAPASCKLIFSLYSTVGTCTQLSGSIPVQASVVTGEKYSILISPVSGEFPRGCAVGINTVSSVRTTPSPLDNTRPFIVSGRAVIPEGDTITPMGMSYAAIDAPSLINVEHGGKMYYHVDAAYAKDLQIPDEVFHAALAEQQASELFKTEKSIALQIMADFNLGTGEHEITGSDISDVRAYIQSIDPAKGMKAGHLQRAKIPRPSIFDRYS